MRDRPFLCCMSMSTHQLLVSLNGRQEDIARSLTLTLYCSKEMKVMTCLKGSVGSGSACECDYTFY
jgi:hypothetical protein